MNNDKNNKNISNDIVMIMIIMTVEIIIIIKKIIMITSYAPFNLKFYLYIDNRYTDAILVKGEIRNRFNLIS